ncbi:MAG TPA: ATP-binding cassette domain-containing protein, partial [Candidatus Dwaynia gallinarum]|nr:ATP-binding cassette domain-containing protein [Candidatus Dwaynia gallinarum]
LKVENLTKKGMFENISFEVRKGEILGVSGLMGAGRSEIMNAIFGNIKVDEGKIIIDGNEVNIRSPRDAINFGIGFVTEDRKNEGLILDNTIRENIALTNLDLISNKFGIIDSNKEIKTVEKDIEKFKIKCSSSEQICGGLSGGNQQKVVFAKWIDLNPKIFILDEPTRGVDVGSKKEIYNIINELIARGVGIILVSSELPEVLGLSDRVLVINEGKVSGILNRKDATQENVMKLAVGGSL